MKREQIILIVSMFVGSWLGMQAVHELGHVLGAWLGGATVNQVVLHPLTISRTDVSPDPHPLLTVWAGPMFGVALPLVLWGIAAMARMPGTFVLRFFVGFCLIANGLYISVGAIEPVGDPRELLRHGASLWQLILFGLLTAPLGLWLWNGLGRYFGLGPNAIPIDRRVAYVTLAICIALIALGLTLGEV